MKFKSKFELIGKMASICCSICDEKFERNDDREEHLKIHEAPYDEVSIENRNRIIFWSLAFILMFHVFRFRISDTKIDIVDG